MLTLRIAGMFQRQLAGTLMGTALCIGTVGVFTAALVQANRDRVDQKRAGNVESNDETTNAEELTKDSADDSSFTDVDIEIRRL